MGASQDSFHQRWPDLRDVHVRALAWLLDAPDLMAPDAPCWQGHIATLGPLSPAVVDWLHALERDPAPLHQHLQRQPTGRLGRYAEQLLGFYLQQQGQLVATNLQVRNLAPSRETLGEFDFLLRRAQTGGQLEHWEFATKFYLLQTALPVTDDLQQDQFVGPNLADSLGRKMRKIMQQQLQLSASPAAAQVLPAPVTVVGALVKGWLFYRDGVLPVPPVSPAAGIASDHCHGFWGEVDLLSARFGQAHWHFVRLPRLQWLAPARMPFTEGMALPQTLAVLVSQLAAEDAPVLLAVCRREGDELIEVERGFIVPPGWAERAAGQPHAPQRVPPV